MVVSKALVVDWCLCFARGLGLSIGGKEAWVAPCLSKSKLLRTMHLLVMSSPRSRTGCWQRISRRIAGSLQGPKCPTLEEEMPMMSLSSAIASKVPALVGLKEEVAPCKVSRICRSAVSPRTALARLQRAAGLRSKECNECMHECMHACMFVCMYLCMHACMLACVRACVHVCVYVALRHAFFLADLRTWPKKMWTGLVDKCCSCLSVLPLHLGLGGWYEQGSLRIVL